MVNPSLDHEIKVYLGLGSNMGDKQANMAQALKLLPPEVIVVQVSYLYESEPVGNKDQPWFLNAAACGFTDLNPLRLLEHVKRIEEQIGRLLSFRNAPRPIDIDILFYGDESMETESLTIPHPRIPERAFVLAPMAELEPDYLHPTRNQTMAEMLSAIPEPEKVWRRKWSPLHSRDLLRTPSGYLRELGAGESGG